MIFSQTSAASGVAAGNLASDSRKELRYREQFVYEKQRL